jgi:hypothetical protein
MNIRRLMAEAVEALSEVIRVDPKAYWAKRTSGPSSSASSAEVRNATAKDIKAWRGFMPGRLGGGRGFAPGVVTSTPYQGKGRSKSEAREQMEALAEHLWGGSELSEDDQVEGLAQLEALAAVVAEEEELAEQGMAEKNWIQNAIKKPGALHKALGVPAGKKIPLSKEKAAAETGGKLGARARLALTLRKMNKT